ncbi:MAG: protein kinase [Pseudomonadota bacterium]
MPDQVRHDDFETFYGIIIVEYRNPGPLLQCSPGRAGTEILSGEQGQTMIFEDPDDLRRRIAQLTQKPTGVRPGVCLDTSDFMSIDVGSVIRVADSDFLVLGHGREGRFGMDEQPKFWVKNTLDLTSGERKILKLEFKESFTNRIGDAVFRCFRNPEKEAVILQRMRDHPSFMQGRTVRDAMDNLVRIVDFIPGLSLYENLRRLDISHEVYYRERLSGQMQRFIGCIEAIAGLHEIGLHHGDIRADHILIHKQTGGHVWIDFDYEVSHPEYDLFCLGNILLQVVGKGRHSRHDVRLRPSEYPGFREPLCREDMSMMFQHRVANLRKLFPYISPDLNELLLRFSAGNDCPHLTVGVLLSNLRSLFPPDHSGTNESN